jgi:hypothetical protein
VIRVHAVWTDDQRLHLWGETAASRPAGGRGRGPARHPFAAAAAELADALQRAGVPAGRAVAAGLRLPSRGRSPLRSDAAPPPGLSLRPWSVPALAYEPEAAAGVLQGLAAESPAGLDLAPSIRFFQAALQLALAVVASGHVLPALVGVGGRHFALWEPVPTPEERRRLRSLAAAMPAACRAASGASPERLLLEFLNASADVLVRAGLEAAPPLPPASSAPAAWLRALASGDPAVRWRQASEIDRLGAHLEGWRRAGLPPDAAFRPCFRLLEPGPAPEDTEAIEDGQGVEGWGQAEAGSGGAWRVELLLQSTDDPSLLMPAGQVWGRRAYEHHLLRGLGRASRLWPALERALEAAHPTHLELDTAEAHAFLRSAAPLLGEAGFGVLLPAWWHRREEALGLRLRARGRTPGAAETGTGLLGKEGLCDYRWELALGDERLSAAELEELARLKVPLVRLRGRWVELRPDELQAALRFLERQPAGDRAAPVVDVLRMGLGLEPVETGLPVVGVRPEGWLRRLVEEAHGGGSEGRLQEAPQPEGFQGAMRPYQLRGLSWLRFLAGVGLGGCLADDMGLGKTIQLLALLLAERAHAGGDPPGPTLLVCPMSLTGNWEREAERFAPSLRLHVHHGTGRRQGADLAQAAGAADLVITTYPLLVRDRRALSGVEWHRVVLDEAQNVKNSAAKQAQVARQLRARQRVALTGTPVENRLAELWSIMDFCNPGLLGPSGDFRRRFAVPVERYHDEGTAALLRRLTAPFILRRLKTDRSIIADLPEKVEMKVFCNITREQATLYQAVLDDMLARIEESQGIARRGLVLATMTKLKQVLNHPAQLLGDGSALAGRSGKLSRLEEILEEVLAEGDRALCFTQYAEMGAMLRSHLESRLRREVLFLHGGTPRGERDEMVARFQGRSGPPVFVLSLKAGGTGLNLTAASHVIHFDRWWNPAVEDQATDRAFRIGQRKDVQVRKLISVGTMEERVDRMIEAKRDLAERIVGSGEAWLTELSTSELRELVALSREAVAQ